MNNKIIIIYLLITIVIFSIFVPPDAYLIENIRTFHIKMSPVYIHILISIVFLTGFIIFNKIIFNIDIVSVFLLLRIPVSLIPVFYIPEASNSMGRVLVPIICLVSYLIFRQYTGKDEYVRSIFLIFGIVLSVQVIYTWTQIDVDYNSYYYTSYMKIPIASSNLIASFLTPILCMLVMWGCKKRLIKYIVGTILLVAILLTNSRGGIYITSICFISIFIVRNKKWNTVQKVNICLITILSIIVMLNLEWVSVYILNPLGIDIRSYEGLSDFSNGRIEIIGSEIMRWTEHILFGNGMVYQSKSAGAHNILIDLLVQGGIVGFSIYIIPITYIIYKSYIYAQKNSWKELLPYLVFIGVTFMHSLIETSYFNYVNDMLFWAISGCLMAKLHYLKIEKQ